VRSSELDELRAELATYGIRNVEHHATIDSTQSRGHLLGREAAEETLPALVLANEQTAGRGRGENSWWTGVGSLAMTIVLPRGVWGLSSGLDPRRSLAVGIAIVRAVQEAVPGHELGLHWPNDVFLAGRKLAGVLVDALPSGRQIVGLGINTNNTFADAPAEVRERGVSLLDCTGRSTDHGVLVPRLCAELQAALCELDAAPNALALAFNQLCLQKGKLLAVDSAGERIVGRCDGIAPDGALVLRTENGPRRVYSGVLLHSQA
jgi:BirA family biotin operon repressor/biotin-[acetyl-CoA-carboxylase] ligase